MQMMTGDATPVRHRGYPLMAGLLVITMLGGTLPIPLYVLYERQMGFGPLGVTVVFAAYVIGTLSAPWCSVTSATTSAAGRYWRSGSAARLSARWDS